MGHRTRTSPSPTGVLTGEMSRYRRADLTQIWTRAVPTRGARRPVPEGSVVHATYATEVPTRALCGVEVGHLSGIPWPPKWMHRCERSNSLASAMPA